MIKADGDFLGFFERQVSAGLRLVTIGIWATMLILGLRHKELSG